MPVPEAGNLIAGPRKRSWGNLTFGRESGPMDLRPPDRSISGADRSQRLRDAQDVGRVPAGVMATGG